MEPSKDDEFIWSAEGFGTFPRRLPDDCVEYIIYIIDNAVHDLELRNQLHDIQTAATLLVKNLLKSYIWQREPFILELVREEGT